MTVLLELRDVSKSIGQLMILSRLSFRLQAGEALGILGPNGAGKTTMLNLIAGETAPSDGKVFFKETDVTAVPAYRRCRLGIARTYQIPRPFGDMTVLENVLVGATYSFRNGGAPMAICRHVLDQAGLLERRDELAGRLGLLDRKRLELARALAARPSLLLLDEIGGGLTQRELEQLSGVIGRIRENGTTLIWIEHVVHVLASGVDRILAINFGTRLCEGPPAEVLASREFQEVYLGVE